MNKLNELMIGKALSQKEIALAVGVSRPTVSDWVNNKKDPHGDNLLKLAKFLEVDWKDILVTKAPTPEDYAAQGIALRTIPQTSQLSETELDILTRRIQERMGVTPSLSPAEQEMIDDFRQLSNTQKSRIRAMIAGYLDAKYGAD